MEGEPATGPLEAIQMVDVGEAAVALKVSPKTVRRLCWRGELDFVRVGRNIRISPDAITAYLDKHRNGQSGDAA